MGKLRSTDFATSSLVHNEVDGCHPRIHQRRQTLTSPSLKIHKGSVMHKPVLFLMLTGCLLSGCESLSSIVANGDTQVAPLKIQTGGPDSNEFRVVEAEEVKEELRPEIPESNPSPIAPVGFGKRSRPDGRYFPLVLFPFDSWELTPEAEKTLQDAGHWLRTSLHGELTIEGHTDTKGTRAYNQALGYKRAQAVMNYLKDIGINPQIMESISFGELDPICEEDDAFCFDMNRRAFMFVADRNLSSLLKSFEMPKSDDSQPLQENRP